MNKERLVRYGAEAFIGVLTLRLLTMAFTPRQREAIVSRDNRKCQAPIKHNCGGGLQVHHLIPQRYAYKMGIDPDYAENGITLCANFHQGIIHEDMTVAKQAYGRDHDSFKKAFAEREKKLNNREIYWNDKFDRLMTVIAQRNTQRARSRGWQFPVKNGRH